VPGACPSALPPPRCWRSSVQRSSASTSACPSRHCSPGCGRSGADPVQRDDGRGGSVAGTTGRRCSHAQAGRRAGTVATSCRLTCRFRAGTLALVAQVVRAVRIPVIGRRRHRRCGRRARRSSRSARSRRRSHRLPAVPRGDHPSAAPAGAGQPGGAGGPP
jgi:hypothetical protein